MDILEIGNNGHMPMILKWNGHKDEVYLSWGEWQRVLKNNGVEFSPNDFDSNIYLNYDHIKMRYNVDLEASGNLKANPN